ncbi:hypothetical protein BDR04DRAFT_1102660 [Suillus decipiens]|nr:hypothetical protein BDR04DRAFT_1102660 [Suillus decipiens]
MTLRSSPKFDPRRPRRYKLNLPTERTPTTSVASLSRGRKWQLYKNLRPKKDGQLRIIKSFPVQSSTRKPWKSMRPSPVTRQPTILIDVIGWCHVFEN